MTEMLIICLSGAVGAITFGVLYHVNPRHLLLAFMGGLLTTTTLVLCMEWCGGNNIISNAIRRDFQYSLGGVFSTWCAHKRPAPVPVFMIPSLFPLVPGRALYYSMSALVLHESAQFASNFLAAAEISFGIAVGMLFAGVFCDVFLGIRNMRK